MIELRFNKEQTRQLSAWCQSWSQVNMNTNMKYWSKYHYEIYTRVLRCNWSNQQPSLASQPMPLAELVNFYGRGEGQPLANSPALSCFLTYCGPTPYHIFSFTHSLFTLTTLNFFQIPFYPVTSHHIISHRIHPSILSSSLQPLLNLFNPFILSLRSPFSANLLFAILF